MRKKNLNRLIIWTATGTLSVCFLLGNIVVKDARAFTSKSGIVDVASLNVRSNAGTGNAKIATLTRDASVTVLDEVNDGKGMYWYKISFDDGTGAKEGFAAKSYIKTISTAKYTVDKNFEAKIAAFPESYKDRLRALHAEYPNWVFIAVDVGINWEEVVANEAVVGRNLVSKSSKSSWKSTAKGAYNWNTSSWPGFDSNEWVAASEGIIRYYMDPRNFLDSTNIYQFLHHGYTTGEQTASGVEKMLKGTFMESKSTISETLSSVTTTASTQGPSVEVSAANTDSPESETVSGTANGPMAAAHGGAQSEADTVGASPNRNTAAEAARLEAPSLEGDTAPGDSIGPASDIRKSTYTTPSTTAEFNDINNGPGAVNDKSIKESLHESDGIYSSTETETAGTTPVELSDRVSYVDMIMDAAKSSGVNPYVLSAMLIQEQGTKGTSGLISGKGGIYNFFNIEAYQSGKQSATDRGLAWAGSGNTYLRPWNTRAKAIIGGAVYYGENYVKAGQNSFYLKKFNVLGDNRYKHQYMTNIEGAKSEGARLAMAYSEEDKKGQFTFYIPVYRDMPFSPASMPNGDGSPNYKLSSLSVEGHTLRPAFSKDNFVYTVELPYDADSIHINANTEDTNASVSGTGDVSLVSSEASVTVTAQNGTQAKYTINITRKGGNLPQSTVGDSYGSGSGSQSGDTAVKLSR